MSASPGATKAKTTHQNPAIQFRPISS